MMGFALYKITYSDGTLPHDITTLELSIQSHFVVILGMQLPHLLICNNNTPNKPRTCSWTYLKSYEQPSSWDMIFRATDSDSIWAWVLGLDWPLLSLGRPLDVLGSSSSILMLLSGSPAGPLVTTDQNKYSMNTFCMYYSQVGIQNMIIHWKNCGYTSVQQRPCDEVDWLFYILYILYNSTVV